MLARIAWGPSVCEGQAGFGERVRERTRRVRFVEDGARIDVRLSIQPEGEALAASVTLVRSGRVILKRRVASPSCDDALDALALIVAIGLEARAETRGARGARVPKGRRAVTPPPKPADREAEPPAAPDAAPSESSAGAPEPPPAQLGAPPPSGAESSASTVAPAATPEPEPAPPAAPPVRSASSSAAPDGAQAAPRPLGAAAGPVFAFAGGASGDVLIGAGPGALVGARGWAQLRWERSSPWSPALVLEGARRWWDGAVAAQGRAEFVLDSLTAAFCPLVIGGSKVELAPCAQGTLGWLRAEGEAAVAGFRSSRPWAGVGGQARVTARLGLLELHGSLGLERPLVRDSFRFGGGDCSLGSCGEAAFHRVKPAVYMAALGLGLGFR